MPPISRIFIRSPRCRKDCFFLHRLEAEHDSYVTSHTLSFDSRERLERFVDSFNQVIARHDILRTAVLWEGLREPVQVVYRQAALSLQWREKFDPRHRRIDVRQAPMFRLIAAQDPTDKRWLLQIPSHHLVLDHATLEQLVGEIALIQQGRQAELPVPLPFRDFVAQARLGVSEAEHEPSSPRCWRMWRSRRRPLVW
ncbi:MAG: condensation domain-containing protein [Cellvibrionaceae bacterium]|nr:condensation domain-containing protein [Cellvibrionaceae bacterium]